ncbi:hypothetical protein ACIBO5_56410 [Nonomuraea angiospora]|uniref:hypothetical protein n=1 Tax=Nonomuraea angiospora TaxID=46172 RepID=UPI0037A7056F
MTIQQASRRGTYRQLAVAAAATMSLSACVSTEPNPLGADGDPCSVMVKSAAALPTAATHAILIDRSGSTEADDPAAFVPDWAASLRPVIPIGDGAKYLIAPFAGGRHLSWPETPLVAPQIRGTSRKQAPIRAAVTDCIAQQVERTMLKPGVPKKTDILGAFYAAGTQLASTPGTAKHIYMATDGYPSEGCAQVKIGRELTGDDIARIVEGCRSELPQNLRGITITIVGIGTSSSKMHAAQPGAIASLARLWDVLCHQMTQTCTVRTGAPTDDVPTPAAKAAG